MNETFAKDFINLQNSISTMPKDKSGYGYKYTDLDTIIKTIKPLLHKNNIGFIQQLKTVDGRTGIETILVHTSGETLSAFVEIPEIQVGKANNAQNVGAAITYFKRYALAAAFGISSDEDIDCSSQALESHNRASETAPTVKASSNKKSDTPQKNISKNDLKIKLYTKEQADQLGELVNTTYKNGEALFTDDEKANFRKMLVDGYANDAINQASEIVKFRKDDAGEK